VTDDTGNSLQIGGSFIYRDHTAAAARTVSGGGWYTDCGDWPIYPQLAHYTTCTWITEHDPATVDGSTTTNNSSENAIYDACGKLIVDFHQYGWWSTDTNFPNGSVYNGGYLSGPLLTPATDSSCYGTWIDAVSFTQTFSNGRTLTVSASEPYEVYPSLDAATADRTPQPPPTGDPINPKEQMGQPGCEKPTHCSTGDPIDTATGNFGHTFQDLSIPGRGPALNLSRTYNSLAAADDGPFGYGWSSTYGISLSIDTSTVVVHQGNGAQATFTYDGTNWTAPPRVLAALRQNADGTWTFTRESREIFTFDSAGQLTAIADLNGYRTTIDHPSSSSMLVTDPAGRTLTFSLSGPHVTTVQDSSSPTRTISYGYDAAGNLTDVVDVGGGHWQFTYDSAHRMLTMRSPRYYGDTTTTPSPVVTNHYDAQGRVDQQTDQLGRVTSLDYTTVPGSTLVTDPRGRTVRYGYTDGLLTTVTAGYRTASAASWYYRYDPDTLGRISTFDPDGHTTTATYDAAGNLTSSTDGLGRTTTYTYNALREVTSVIEPKQVNGQPITTTLTYDSGGNLLTKSAPLLDSTGATTATAVTTYHHDDSAHPGDLTSVTDPNGHTSTATYDSVGDLASVTDPAGDKTSFGYDTGRGWRTSQVSPKGNVTGADPAAYTTTYAYDAYGRPALIRDPLWTSTAPSKHQSTRHYDADGNLDSVTDADGHTTTYTYDPAGELTSAGRADSTTLRTDYWPDGTIRHQYDAANQATAYDYDTVGNLASITDPLGRGTLLKVDGVGNLVTSTDPAGRTTTYTYDAANELTALNYSDPATPDVTNISYDGDGQRTAMTDGTGATTWVWDSLHRMTSSTTGAGNTIGYHYDLADRLTAVDYPGSTGTVSRGYDNADRLTSITDWNSHQTTFGYDPDSNLTSQAYPNGTTAATSYNEADQVTGIQHAPTANPAAPFASFSYGRDGAGLLTSVTSTGVPADTHTYGYNSLNQLTGVDTSTYGYDPADNLTKRLDNTRQIYDAANELGAVTTNPAISLVGTASAGDATSSALTLTLPAGTTPGDQVLVAASLANSKSVTTPTGYTLIGSYASSPGNSAGKIVVFRHTVAAGDTAVTFSFQGKIAKTVTLAVYRNVHPTNPIDTTSSGATAAGTSVVAASQSPAAIGDQLVMIAGASGTAGTWTMPTGMITRVQKAGGTTDAAIADQPLTAAGATGSRTATHSVSTQLAGALITLRPAQTSIGYDQQGNRTSVQPLTGAATTLGYDQANRLTSYAATASYTYNGDGLRTAKTVSGTTTSQTWDTSTSLPTLLTDGSTAYIYGPDGLPLEQVTSSGTLYYHHDQLGSTRALTNSTGTVVASYTYDPYGNLTASTGTATNPFRYAGQYTDPETGYQYLRNRYYDPATAQFLTRDPLVPVTWDPYGYAGRTPLNATDPTGLSIQSVLTSIGNWLTTPTELPNPGYVTGAVKIGTGTAEVYTGLNEAAAAPGLLTYDGVTRTLQGAWDTGEGFQDLHEANQHPEVCDTPLHWGTHLAGELGLDYAKDKFREAASNLIGAKYFPS
jgi:RHS repeat-associated protein